MITPEKLEFKFPTKESDWFAVLNPHLIDLKYYDASIEKKRYVFGGLRAVYEKAAKTVQRIREHNELARQASELMRSSGGNEVDKILTQAGSKSEEEKISNFGMTEADFNLSMKCRYQSRLAHYVVLMGWATLKNPFIQKIDFVERATDCARAAGLFESTDTLEAPDQLSKIGSAALGHILFKDNIGDSDNVSKGIFAANPSQMFRGFCQYQGNMSFYYRNNEQVLLAGLYQRFKNHIYDPEQQREKLDLGQANFYFDKATQGLKKNADEAYRLAVLALGIEKLTFHELLNLPGTLEEYAKKIDSENKVREKEELDQLKNEADKDSDSLLV